MESSCVFRVSASVFPPYLTMLSGQAFYSPLEFSSLWSCRDPSTHMVSPTPVHVHTPALSLAGFRTEGSSRVCSLLEEVTSFKAHFLSVRDNFFFLDPRVGPGYFKAFPAQEFIFGFSKRKGK